MKHIVCYSGGHSSALVAVEVVRAFGKDNVVLLNHDINLHYEDEDIKRFKREVADYLNLPITYKNFNDLPLSELPNQFEVCEEAGSFVNPATRQALCTNRLKTAPFTSYLEHFHHDKNCVIYYGFDMAEPDRIERRRDILLDMGYRSDYPLALWSKEGVEKYNHYQINIAMKSYNKINSKSYEDPDTFILERPEFRRILNLEQEREGLKRSIFDTNDIGILPPNSYSHYKHANCKGCLKGGQQHWYIVYCHSYNIFQRAILSEERIGYSIIKGHFLKDLESKFAKMKTAGVPTSEHIPFQTFWAKARKYLKTLSIEEKPCECVF